MKLLITGGTGSGKTFKAFELARELGSFAYLSPTKFLAYESFIEYGYDDSRINTSSVRLGPETAKNYFGCYASVGQWDVVDPAIHELNAYKKADVMWQSATKLYFSSDESRLEYIYSSVPGLEMYIPKKDFPLTMGPWKHMRDAEYLLKNVPKEPYLNMTFDTIIIDEAHWAANHDNHSYWIKRMVNEHPGNIILVTAENINPPAGFEVITLESTLKINGWVHAGLDPEYSYKEDEDNYNDEDEEDETITDYDQTYQWSEWINSIPGSQASLAICSAVNVAEWLSTKLTNLGVEHHLVHRGMPESCIIDSFFGFKATGGILIATNMAQQGINLPCDNLFLSLNGHDDTTSITQKLGRIARRGYTTKSTQNKVYIDIDADYKWYSEDVYELVYSIQGSHILAAKNYLKSSMDVNWTPHSYNHNDEPPYDPPCDAAAATLFEYISKRKELAA